jgi:hypothetical protein
MRVMIKRHTKRIEENIEFVKKIYLPRWREMGTFLPLFLSPQFKQMIVEVQSEDFNKFLNYNPDFIGATEEYRNGDSRIEIERGK